MDTSQEMASIVTVNDVSRVLNVQEKTVRRWGDRGILRSYLFGDRGDRIFEKKDIDRFLIKLRLLISDDRKATYLEGLLIHK